jgi:hypothetical protein
VSIGAISGNIVALIYINSFLEVQSLLVVEKKAATDRVVDGLLRHIEIRPKNNH